MESTKLLPLTETIKPSPGYTLIVRCIIQNKVGMLGKVTTAIGEAGGDIGAVDLVEFQKDKFIRDINIRARNEEHGQQIVNHLKKVQGLEIEGYTSTRLPVLPVFSQELPSREEAKTCERQIKGWSRGKKEALLRGDWAEISRLGRSKKHPSTVRQAHCSG